MYTEEIHNLLTAKFQEESFQDCFFFFIEQTKKSIRIFIDADSGINFEKCQKISRYLESHFDEKSWFGDDYLLEVSSPGIDRPLLFPRQYKKNIGRDLQLTLNDGSQSQATIKEVAEDYVIVTREEIRKEGKKKVKETIETHLPYHIIKEAKIVIKI